ncbi:MAG: hypothetical protein AB7F99_09455 [Vicinamibacterales bacterium]
MPADTNNPVDPFSDCKKLQARIDELEREDAAREAELESLREQADRCRDEAVARANAVAQMGRRPALDLKTKSAYRLRVGSVAGIGGVAVTIAVLWICGLLGLKPAPLRDTPPVGANAENWLERIKPNIDPPDYKEGRRILRLDEDKP